MNLGLKICLNLYRRLASAYPHEFRMLYGEDFDRTGEDAVPEVWRRYGVSGLLRLLADLAVRLPAEHLAEIRRDGIYALRKLAKSPGLTAVGILSVAIGVGLCSVVLSETNGLLGPLPGARDPSGLVVLRKSVSYPYFQHYREQRQAVAAATAVLSPVPFAVASPGDVSAKSERLYGQLVSPEYFTTLGVTPAMGRFFRPDTEKPGMAPVVVVTDRFWRTHLNADPGAVGRNLRVNGRLATIVGVGPEEFLGIWPWNPADLFVPVTCGASVAPELGEDALRRRDLEIFRVVLRLADGVTVAAAEAALDAVTRTLDRETGFQRDRDRKGRMVRLMPAGSIAFVTPGQRAFFHTFNVVLWTLVLSLVCANLATLLLAHGSDRRREVAVRLSVGASRLRLVRQFLTESVLISLAGGLAGIVLAYGLTDIISSLPMPSTTPFRINFHPDFLVGALTLAISFLAGIGFGLPAALACARTDIGLTLKEGAQAGLHGYRRFGIRNVFVVCQVTASLMLLLVTGFIARGYQHTARLDPGFDVSSLNLLSLDPMHDGYSQERSEALLAALPGELSRVSGVRSVALAGGVPFANLLADQPNTRVWATAPEGGNEVQCAVFRQCIGAGYFAALGVPLLRGREFERDYREPEAPAARPIPAIINQTARELFGTEDPIGRRIREDTQPYTVLGVTRDVRSGFLMPKPIATVFLPMTAKCCTRNRAQGMTVLVRGAAGRDTLDSVRVFLTSRHPDLTVFNVRTMRQNIDQLNAYIQWSSSIYIVLGLFALLLACIGLGGITAYAVKRRRKEIGIRMALGARSSQVQALVLREGITLVAAGSVLGFGGAYAIRRTFAAFSDVLAQTFDTNVTEPILIVGVPLLLAGLAMLACYLPARRATQLNPVGALREE